MPIDSCAQSQSNQLRPATRAAFCFEIEKCERAREKMRTACGSSITMKTRKMCMDNFYGKRR